MNAVIYTRFSPRRDSDKSESCEVQLAYCEQYCAKQKHTVKGVFHDPDVSGADEYREKLWQAINTLQKGWVLIVYKRDRLARNVFLSEQINRAVEKHGATTEAVSGDVAGNTPETAMIRQVLASIAEYERKIIGIRTSHAMRFHQKNGRRMGAACPYGWQDDAERTGLMVPSESERGLIQAILARVGGGESAYGVMTWLNSEHRGESRHGKWNIKTVKKIIAREGKQA